MSGFRNYALALKDMPNEFVDDSTQLTCLDYGFIVVAHKDLPPLVWNPNDAKWYEIGPGSEGAGNAKH